MERTISYQAADSKWYDLVVYDLIDPACSAVELAAPDLLEACRGSLSALLYARTTHRMECKCDNDTNSICDLCSLIQEIKDAVAKAEEAV